MSFTGQGAAYKKYLLAVLVFNLAFNYVDRLALGLLLQDIKIDLQLNDTQLGFLTGLAFAAFYSTMGIPIARWADRGNRVVIISLAAALSSAAVAACGAAANFVQLLLIRVSVAVGEAGCVPPAHSLIADHFSRAERPRAVAIYKLGLPLSLMIGYFLAGWLNELYGWRATFVLLGVPGLLLAALVALTLRDPRARALRALRDAPRTPDPSPSLRQVCTTLWANATFRHLVLGYSVMSFFGQGILQWKSAFFIRTHGLQTGELGTWFALLYGLGGLLGTYLGGVVASRYAANNERLQLKAMAIMYVVYVGVSSCIYLSPTPYLAFAMVGLSAIGGSSTVGPVFAMMQTLIPERMRAMSIALLFLFSNLIGMGLGPLAAGILSDVLRTWAGNDSLRFALLAMSPGYFWVGWHFWRASKTVARDLDARTAEDRAETARQGNGAAGAEADVHGRVAVRAARERLMSRDMRETRLYQEAEALYAAFRRPGTGLITDATEANAASDGMQAVFTGSIVEFLHGVPPTRICHIDLRSGATRVLTFGPNTDRLPKYSPDDKRVAFLSDRARAGDFQLFLLDPVSGAARATPRVNGWVEYLHWSPDGSRILLGVAGHGADITGPQGAVTSRQESQDLPSWMPTVESVGESYRWRRVWIYEVASDRVRQVFGADVNVWEAVWCGNESIAAVVSPIVRRRASGTVPACTSWDWVRPRAVERSTDRRINSAGRPHRPPAGSWRSSKPCAVIAGSWPGTCGSSIRLRVRVGASMRVASTSRAPNGAQRRTCCWPACAASRLSSACTIRPAARSRRRGQVRKSPSHRPSRCPASASAATACSLERATRELPRSPRSAAVTIGPVRSFDAGYGHCAEAIGAVDRVAWHAPDGLEIQGWLLRPRNGARPHPLVLNVHGGPISNWRPVWLGRPRGVPILMLVQRGYAVFMPNPRGSSGRGQDFARHVVGDMGGADTYDSLSGLDFLVEQRLADPRRLGVTGISYGGFMTAWLITHDSRFAAAVAVAPVTNQVSEHLISNVPQCLDLLLRMRTRIRAESTSNAARSCTPTG